MKIRYTDTALGEVDEICSYIARDNPSAASDVANAIERTVAGIAERPDSAPVVHAGDVRARLVRGFQFRIFYVTDGHEVLIRTSGGQSVRDRGSRSSRRRATRACRLRTLAERERECTADAFAKSHPPHLASRK
jgi:plasmid stabilization system protein ParE